MDFFDRMGEKLVTAGKDVTQKAKDLSGTAKLNFDIKAKEDFIEKQYAQIGKLYYEDHKEEADGAYGQQMQAIAEAFAAIDHMKEEVLKLKERVSARSVAQLCRRTQSSVENVEQN